MLPCHFHEQSSDEFSLENFLSSTFGNSHEDFGKKKFPVKMLRTIASLRGIFNKKKFFLDGFFVNLVLIHFPVGVPE